MLLKTTLCMQAASLPLQVVFVGFWPCLHRKLVSTSHECQLVIAPMLFTQIHSKQRTFHYCIRGMLLVPFESRTGLFCRNFMLNFKIKKNTWPEARQSIWLSSRDLMKLKMVVHDWHLKEAQAVEGSLVWCNQSRTLFPWLKNHVWRNQGPENCCSPTVPEQPERPRDGKKDVRRSPN